MITGHYNEWAVDFEVLIFLFHSSECRATKIWFQHSNYLVSRSQQKPFQSNHVVTLSYVM